MTFKVFERNRNYFMLLVKCLLEGTGNIWRGLAKVPKQKLTKCARVEKEFLVASWNCVSEII